MKKIILIIFSWALTFTHNAHASMVEEGILTCPVGGENFHGYIFISYRMRNRHLDGKPQSWKHAPYIAACPSNGFVIYRNDFSSNEIERLTSLVNSAEYQNLRKIHTDYYLAAVLAKFIHEKKFRIANFLMYATWEAGSPEQYQAYADEALAAFKDMLATTDYTGDQYNYHNKKQWIKDMLIAGELARRLSRFDEAEQIITTLLNNKEKILELHQQDIANLELELIRHRISESRPMPPYRQELTNTRQ